MRLVASGQLDAAKFVTHRFDLDEFEQAYDVFSDAATSGALKVVLTRSEARRGLNERRRQGRHDTQRDHR